MICRCWLHSVQLFNLYRLFWSILILRGKAGNNVIFQLLKYQFSYQCLLSDIYEFCLLYNNNLMDPVARNVHFNTLTWVFLVTKVIISQTNDPGPTVNFYIAFFAGAHRKIKNDSCYLCKKTVLNLMQFIRQSIQTVISGHAFYGSGWNVTAITTLSIQKILSSKYIEVQMPFLFSSSIQQKYIIMEWKKKPLYFFVR